MDAQRIFPGLAVTDIDEARAFYSDVLGIPVTAEHGFLTLDLTGGGTLFVYGKDEHVPAQHTVLNLEVADIDAAVDELAGKGVEMLRYDEMTHDERGIVRPRGPEDGPPIAWFTDPSGNIIGVMQG
ncbi:MAG TPA: VOC family protein [Microbacterium sp.]|uniref:VOC family protein n=1 Tax=Microbacterium sp. TaxID=51671 RepID=UPI002C65FB78|nr:VOC family protein [Microbacterium sp.]HWI31368.1 VOC family protein [Microbacterium sp.]